MPGYNLPPGVSASDKDAPWNQEERLSERRMEKIELMEKAHDYSRWLLEVLSVYEDLDKAEFYLAFRHKNETGPRYFDRKEALRTLKEDIKYLLLDLMPTEED